jgi:hypothetical protein
VPCLQELLRRQMTPANKKNLDGIADKVAQDNDSFAYEQLTVRSTSHDLSK